MRWWTLVGFVLVLGCEHATEMPAVPPPEDLSTWSVPELVQLPPDAAPPPEPAAEKPTTAERVYTFLSGTTFAVTVPVGWPLDILLERGEQVRNIVGGDRAPTEASQPPRWEVKEGADGHGDTLRPHVFLTATTPSLTTGLIITTTRRTYYLTCKSVQTSPTRAIRWHYPPGAPEPPKAAKTPGRLPDLSGVGF
jgi:type IV secretory pathway VirB9-like protein